MRKFGGKPVQRVHVMLKPVTGACLHEHNFLLGLSIDGLKNLHDIYLFAQSTLERLIDKHLTEEQTMKQKSRFTKKARVRSSSWALFLSVSILAVGRQLLELSVTSILSHDQDIHLSLYQP